MTPRQIYSMTPIHSHHEVGVFRGCYYDQLPEVQPEHHDFWNLEPERVEIRVVRELNLDGERFWRLSTVWFDGHPVMILQNAGRGGGDFSDRYITDLDQFIRMVQHIQSLIDKDRLSDVEAYDPDWNLPDLTYFYFQDVLEDLPR